LSFYSAFIGPIIEYAFMRRALLSCLFFCLSAIPFGLLLQLRRLSLLGEAISHGLLPGIAIAYMITGFWIPSLLVGGIFSSLALLLLSRFLASRTKTNEDASLSSLYLVFLSLGVMIISLKVKATCNLTHLLFGNILAVDADSLMWIGVTSVCSFISFIVFYKPFVYECFDRDFSKQIGLNTSFYYMLFLTFIAGNVVLACQTMGTLMALGMMMIPVSIARLFGRHLNQIILYGILIGFVLCYLGLFLSYHFNLPSGPSMIVLSGLFYILTVLKSGKRS
jgi:zinc/manganese transport system permease protein